ncbi:MAG: cation diffusion facilitator family transporter [Xanthobacteraceae bacterium]|jgi:cation diffusion facilitator family transporter|nr:cation diffusion facilitator family transporter [Xanthobacteraceae bacterium]
MKRVETLAAVSIAVGVAVLALKYLAYHLTGSVALLSDAIESVVNVVTAIVALIAVRFAAQPADKEHPYGHHKAEYVSAVVEGVLIVIAALAILREAWDAYQTPRLIAAPWHGLALNGIATAINAIWCAVLIRFGRARKSAALAADGYHLLTDVFTSIGVFIGIALAATTGIAILDPILAAFVALNILWAGWRMLRGSAGGLLDEALPEETLTRLRAAIAKNADGAIEAHDLRTRQAGPMTFVEFHLVVKGSMSVTEAHDICDRLERAIQAEVTDALISIHVEPDDKAKHSGIVVL